MASKKTKIFISYKRGVEPDDRIAHEIYDALKMMPNFDVFLDVEMGIGVQWAQHIKKEIETSDFFIPILSEIAVQSEMVVEEIKTAHDCGKQNGKPRILPVRMKYDAPFVYPLNAYLNPLNWDAWNSDRDTTKLVSKLFAAIASPQPDPVDTSHDDSHDDGKDTQEHAVVHHAPASQPTSFPNASAQPLELPEGTMRPDSAYYVERNIDKIARDAIRNKGVTITLKGPRQIGKSSLLMRIMDEARLHKKRTVFIDFQLFDKETRHNPEKFFKRFTRTIVRKLKLPNEINSFWEDDMGHSQLCAEYMEECVLPELTEPVVILMDEVESIFDTPFRSDFFGMLRAWHNKRASLPEWSLIDLALVTSTEPYQFIDDLNQSPFNVGVVINIEDFTLEQVEEANRLNKSPLTPGQVDELYSLLNGHPYLTRKAIYIIASNQMRYRDLMATASDWNGPFGDHLRYHLFRLQSNPDFVDAMQSVIDGSNEMDETIFHRLQGAGLVKRDETILSSRCNLYTRFFKEYLHGG